jgi:hypothetical protein
MTDGMDDRDRRLAELLRAVRADVDPALWTRVRARIEARPRVPALIAWAMRPAALAVSLALLVTTAALAVMLGTGGTAVSSEDYATLADALVAERESEVAAPETWPAPAGGAARDSGSGM